MPNEMTAKKRNRHTGFLSSRRLLFSSSRGSCMRAAHWLRNYRQSIYQLFTRHITLSEPGRPALCNPLYVRHDRNITWTGVLAGTPGRSEIRYARFTARTAGYYPIRTVRPEVRRGAHRSVHSYRRINERCVPQLLPGGFFLTAGRSFLPAAAMAAGTFVAPAPFSAARHTICPGSFGSTALAYPVGMVLCKGLRELPCRMTRQQFICNEIFA